ncbi:MAG TPA: hypothetical protein VJ894_07635, partial [Cryomorphaceae bacterium]|nr:hypothetical protein [Cryomorphaceae bacterium]
MKKLKSKFSASVIESLGYYVYLLVDSREGEIFYVGKGKANRVFSHVNDALYSEYESDKLDQIREIHDEGQKVVPLILRHGLTEEEAILVESVVLDLPMMDSLKNKAAGHDSWERGLKSVDEIKHLYDAEEAIIDDPVLIININALYRRFMEPEEIYEATKAS